MFDNCPLIIEDGSETDDAFKPHAQNRMNLKFSSAKQTCPSSIHRFRCGMWYMNGRSIYRLAMSRTGFTAVTCSKLT